MKFSKDEFHIANTGRSVHVNLVFLRAYFRCPHCVINLPAGETDKLRGFQSGALSL